MNTRDELSRSSNQTSHSRWLHYLLIILLTIGISFRFANLEKKVYWHDEVYTTLRSAGYMTDPSTQSVFSNQLVTPKDLQQYQTIRSGSNLQDTLTSLAVEDPQHPPLYFLLNRVWMILFGSSLTALRSLAVLISLASLPAIYFLARELFGDNLTAWFAIVLLALSPLDILFAQVSRQNSLWTLTVILSSLCLIKALQADTTRKRYVCWGFYTLSCIAGFYTHLYFALTYLAQFIFMLWLMVKDRSHIRSFLLFILSSGIAFLAFMPWVIVVATNYSRALSVTIWSSGSYSLTTFKLWFLNLTALFVDLDLGFDNPFTYLLRSPFLLIVLLSFYALWQKQTCAVFTFLVLGAMLPWFLVSLLDFIQSSQRSTVGRYLIGCYPFIQLAIAYGLTIVWRQAKRWCYLFFIPLLTCFLLSNTINAVQLTSWSKNPSIDLGEIINNIAQANTPFILMDRGDSYTNFGNLMALNYFLPPTVQYALLAYPPETEILEKFLQIPTGDTFVYEPTKALKAELINLNYRLDLIPNTNGFFALESSNDIK